MSVLFALTTSLLIGFADFGGGLLTRRVPALTVVVASQAVTVVVLGAVVAATGAWTTADARLWYAVAAGAVGPAAMLCFYRALALGPMGVVSPLGSLGVAVPVAVGIAVGERPGLVQLAGAGVAVAGVVLAGGPELRGAQVRRGVLALTLLAALGFGAVMALISEASSTVPGLFLALFTQRVTNVAVGGGALWAARRRGAAVLPEGPEGAGARTLLAALPALALVGLADVAANGTYSVAAHSGPVTVAAVLASVYPVVTALTARGVLGERLRTVQAAGAGLALAGALLLAVP
ncbi:EamA family transporter [Streptomyces sp. NPDC047002]|uniref:EamA family transporter n=1 Tax=Streptomyces sp. NPDC047002 TaxID=3155475 RepID=UPI0034519660